MACQVIDWAIQAHGGAGVSDVTPLAEFYAGARSLRLADGPDEVHRVTIAKNELGRWGGAR
jgi:acyl-CoA dehydrogenase